jgi:uncharacterized coiled-coil protein SlyX
MEYVGSGITYNALPKFGGIPLRTREINEFAPGRVFYTSVDNIGNLKIGDYFSVNQLTGEVSITSDSFNLTGLNAIGPFRRNGFDAGVILQEVSNNTNLLNSVGLYGEDTVPTQFAVKGYVDPISASLDSRLDKLEISSASLNTFSGSTLGRLTNLETTSGSHNGRLTNLESKSASVDTSIVQLNLYSSSLKTAIELTGSSITILGNLVVKGTQTTIDSTTIQLGDNIIELNGSSNTNGGLLVKDPTAPNTISGSLLWDSTNDYWKAGALANESKILLAGGDGVLSGSTDFSAFSTSVDSRLSNLQTKSASVDISITNINSTTASLNTSIFNLNGATASLYTSASLMTASIALLTSSVVALQAFSGNVNTRFDAVQTHTSSTNNKFSTLATYTGSVETRFSTLGTLTGSNAIRLTNLETTSASVNISVTNLNASSASQQISIDNLNIFSGSVNTRFGTLATYTASLETKAETLRLYTASLNNFTASMTASYLVLSSSVEYINRISFGGIDFNAQFLAIQQTTSSLNTFTSSANIRLNNIEAATSSYETKGRGIFSGSSQVDGTAITNKSITIAGTSVSLGGSITIATILQGTGVVSGSSQILGGSGIASGSYETTGRSIISSSAQIVPLLPAGVISGSSQVITANSITLGTHTTGDYVASLVQGTGVTITNNSGETATPTISIGQAVGTSANVQFSSIGVGTTASGTGGEIRATGDITAYYSSDIRLKENIIPISNALEKVNQISGNTYNWKDGYDEIHSHKGNDIGVIAQEVEEILPQIVTNRDNGFKAVQYEKIIPLLIEAIKELSAKVDRLENK